VSDAGTDWVDVSVPVRDGMVHWPDDPPVRIGLASSIAGGDAANVTEVAMSAHTGTHMDAPRHFLPDGAGIDALPLGVAMGPARVIEISDPDAVTAEELAGHDLATAQRVLLRTRNSDREWWREDFDAGFVHIDPAAAELIAGADVRMVGVDYLSVGGMESGAETHRALLGAGVWIIEGLDLSDVGAGDYDLVCLPLRLMGSDGAPARALLRKRD
jgi:arylformamidase